MICCKKKASRKFANSNVIYVLCTDAEIDTISPGCKNYATGASWLVQG